MGEGEVRFSFQGGDSGCAEAGEAGRVGDQVKATAMVLVVQEQGGGNLKRMRL